MKIWNCNGGNMINNELWKDIDGFENYYQISSFGRIKSKERDIVCGKAKFKSKERYLKSWECKTHNNDSYLYITLCVNGKHYKKSIHRLVATAFIPNNNNMPEVNHKDGNKHNNKVENLEWVTEKQNQQHSWEVLKRKKYKQEYFNLLNKIKNLKLKLIANGDWDKVEKIFKELFENEENIDFQIWKL